MKTYKTMTHKNRISNEMWKTLLGLKHPNNSTEFYILLFDPIFDLGFDYAMKQKGAKMKKSSTKKTTKKSAVKKVAKKKTK